MTARRWLATPALIALLVSAVACGDDSAMGSVDPTDTTSAADAFPIDTTSTTDAVAADTSSPADTSVGDSVAPADTAREDTDGAETATAGLLKSDPTFLVPAGVAERRHVALSGARAAWVERDAPGGTPRLVTWDVTNVDLAPRRYELAALADPRELALDGDTLVYVDVRFGDADVFALDLAAGTERGVATRPGAQRHPAVAAGRIVWEDCRRCVSGDDGAKAEIVLLDLASGAETPLTADERPDRRPVFGRLAGGALAVAWVHDGSTLRVTGVEDATDQAWPVAGPTEGVALAAGTLAWRPSPFIINPDSMMPSDVFLTAVSDGATFPATFHGERRGGLDPVPRASGDRLAFLGSPPDAPDVTRVRVLAPDGTAVAQADAPALATSFAVSAAWAAITAPRADNGGFDDVWVFAQAP